jgi:hypothetical protein
MNVHPHSVLLVTLDSCRLDTAQTTPVPNLARLAPLVAAQAAASFTLPAHAALFAGVSPGVPGLGRPWLDPKAGKLLKLVNDRIAPGPGDWLLLHGRDVVDGFRLAGWPTLGTGAVDWFDVATPPGRALSASFERFWYAGGAGAGAQVAWLLDEIHRAGAPCLAFLNAAETHVPYTHAGAPWDAAWNPCVPFGRSNDAAECRHRQQACLAYVDAALGPLLDAFAGATVLVCADHGDAWGEDGLWEHGVYHPAVASVPLWLRVMGQPVSPTEPLHFPEHPLAMR